MTRKLSSHRERFPVLGRRDTGTSGPDDLLLHIGGLIDSVATGIISLDGEGRIRVFNAAAEKLFGLPRVMVVGRFMGEIGKIMGFDDHSHKALWERLSDAVWAAGAALELEYDFLPKQGQRRVISYSVYPLGRQTWSVGNGVVIILEDVTRKKEMEGQITDARKRLQAMFDGITDGIQVVDNDFRVTAVNKSMTSMLGRDIKIGDACYAACMFGTRVCENCPADETFRSGLPSTLTKRMRISESVSAGGERVFEINTFPLLDRGNRVVQVVEYIKDVTEKVRLAERLEQARRLAELGEMAARVAHEVRNPLNAITGAAHFLATEYNTDETMRKFTALIKRQAVRLDRVASDLLHMSKPLMLQPDRVHVAAVLDQAMESLEVQVRDQQIVVAMDIAPGLPDLIADEMQIEQALHNLIRNAVEAMPGGGTLRLAARRVDNGMIEVSIQDSGRGIPDQDRQRVFQSFYTTKTKGTGLGLTIVDRVVKNHGGDVTISRPEDGGTRVTVRLPLAAPGAAPPVSP